MSNNKFELWIDKIVDQEDEYFYRYIYDAYLTVERNSHSLFYELIPESEKTKLMYKASKEVELEFENEEEKKEFLKYLVNRFCGEYNKDMKEWYDKRHQWHGDDMRNWGDTNKD